MEPNPHSPAPSPAAALLAVLLLSTSSLGTATAAVCHQPHATPTTQLPRRPSTTLGEAQLSWLP